MDHKATAKAALEFLARVDLKGHEVSAFILVNQLLGRIMEGQLSVVEAVPSDAH